MATTFKGYTIRKSGKNFFRVLDAAGHALQPRVHTIEAGEALILSQGRVMTRKEHALVYNTTLAVFPTAAQLISEDDVRSGRCQGYL